TYLHRLDRVAGQRPVVHRLRKAFLDGWNKFLRDHPTHNGIHEFQTWLHFVCLRIRIFWSQFKYNVREFTFTTCLFLINLLVFHVSKQSFFVSHLRSTLVDLNLKFTLQPLNDDLQVKFTHTSQDHLSGFLVSIYLKRRILFHQLGDGHTQFISICLSLWLNRITDYRLRERDFL